MPRPVSACSAGPRVGAGSTALHLGVRRMAGGSGCGSRSRFSRAAGGIASRWLRPALKRGLGTAYVGAVRQSSGKGGVRSALSTCRPAVVRTVPGVTSRLRYLVISAFVPLYSVVGGQIGQRAVVLGGSSFIHLSCLSGAHCAPVCYWRATGLPEGNSEYLSGASDQRCGDVWVALALLA